MRVWSADGHDKLKDFEIEIYGIIDAYSRYIVFIYVGISSRTAVAVQKFFLIAVDEYGVLYLLCSDKSIEIFLMAECQYWLWQANNPDILFCEMYAFGTSLHNIKIES